MDTLLGPVGGGATDVGSLTMLFFLFYFLAATQDIAVDGLALTVLSERNRELGATCNAIGQTLGYFLAYVGFMALNAYGLVTLGGFMAFWGWVFLGSTLWVLAVRNDEHHAPPGSVGRQLLEAYGEMLVVLQLPAVRSFALVLLTCKASLAAFDALVPLELQVSTRQHAMPFLTPLARGLPNSPCSCRSRCRARACPRRSSPPSRRS